MGFMAVNVAVIKMKKDTGPRGVSVLTARGLICGKRSVKGILPDQRELGWFVPLLRDEASF
jgi:hypothetical protein